MKIKDLIIAVVIILLLFLCVVIVIPNNKSYQEASGVEQQDYCNGYFTVETEWRDGAGIYRIVYANDTGVKYFYASYGGGNYAITPLYNADGSLQVHEE